jgi:hypothetical protein
LAGDSEDRDFIQTEVQYFSARFWIAWVLVGGEKGEGRREKEGGEGRGRDREDSKRRGTVGFQTFF